MRDLYDDNGSERRDASCGKVTVVDAKPTILYDENGLRGKGTLSSPSEDINTVMATNRDTGVYPSQVIFPVLRFNEARRWWEIFRGHRHHLVHMILQAFS